MCFRSATDYYLSKHIFSINMQKSIILFILFNGIKAQVPFFGPCPDVKTMNNFDLTKVKNQAYQLWKFHMIFHQYLGKWYEAERYFALFEFGGKCVTANYNFDNNGAVYIQNQQISAL